MIKTLFADNDNYPKEWLIAHKGGFGITLVKAYSFEYGLKLIEDRLVAKRKGLKS